MEAPAHLRLKAECFHEEGRENTKEGATRQ